MASDPAPPPPARSRPPAAGGAHRRAPVPGAGQGRAPGLSVWAASQVSVGAAMQDNQTLASLLQRVQQSRQRLQAVLGFVPRELRAVVEPGPLDDESWTLLAANPAAAAKLRHLLPRLTAALHELGWPPRELRVRVQQRR